MLERGKINLPLLDGIVLYKCFLSFHVFSWHLWKYLNPDSIIDIYIRIHNDKSFSYFHTVGANNTLLRHM